MSNVCTWGSNISAGSNHDELIEADGDSEGCLEHWSLDFYLGNHETHEQTALSYGLSFKKKDAQTRLEKMEDYIKELVKDLLS